MLNIQVTKLNSDSWLFKPLMKQDLKEYVFQAKQQQSQAKRQHHV